MSHPIEDFVVGQAAPAFVRYQASHDRLYRYDVHLSDGHCYYNCRAIVSTSPHYFHNPGVASFYPFPNDSTIVYYIPFAQIQTIIRRENVSSPSSVPPAPALED
jgi:hypothetical protein